MMKPSSLPQHRLVVRDSVPLWRRAFQPTARPTVLLVLTGLASLCAVLTVTDCSFMISARYDFDAARVGLFSQAMYDLDGTKLGCLRYPNKDQFDSMFRAGRTFGVLTPMLTLTSMVCMAISLLWRPATSHQRLWSSSKVLLGTATVSQMFAFFALGSDFMCPLHDCKLTGVGTLATFNALLLAGLTVASCLAQGPTQPCLQWWKSSEWGNDDQASPPPRPNALHLPGVDPEVVHYIYGQQQERHKVDPQDNDEHRGGSIHPGDTAMATASNTTTTNNIATSIDLYPTEEQPAPWEELPQECRPDHSWDPLGEDLDGSASTTSSTVGLQSLTTFRFVFVSLIFFAWAVSIAGVQRCSFFMVGPVGEDISHYRGLGLFTRAMYYDGQVLGCLAYPDHLQTDFDSAFLASRVLGSFAALLLTVVLLVMILQFFLDKARRELWLVVRVLLSCATLFELLAFSVFRTDTCHNSDQVTCIPGQLGVWVILNVILLTILSVLVLIMPPPPHPVFAVARRGDSSDGDGSSQTDCDATAATRPTTARTLQTLPTAPDMGPVRLSSARRRYAPTVLEPKGLKLLRLPRSRLSKENRQLVAKEEEDASTAVWSDDGPFPDRILRIDPLTTSGSSVPLAGMPPPPPPSPPAQFISVTVEYYGTQKHVVKTVTHPDGSQTITTTVEELERNEASSIDGGETTDCSILGADDDDGDSDTGGDATSEVVSRRRDRTASRSTRATPPAAAFRPAPDDRRRPIHDVREVSVVRDRNDERDRWETGSDTDGDGSLTVDTCLIDEKEYYSDTA